MTNIEKLEALKKFLKENNIPYKKDYKLRGAVCDLFIDKFKICVRISQEDDQVFYKRMKYGLHPLFIRESETAEVVVEKMQNLIIDVMKAQQKKYKA